MPSVAVQTNPVFFFNSMPNTPPETPTDDYDSMESSTATLIDDYLEPDDEIYRAKAAGRMAEPPQYFRRAPSGIFEPVEPMVINIQVAKIDTPKVEVASSSPVTRTAKKKTVKEHVPKWVDNMEQSVYKCFHWVCPLVRPFVKAAFIGYGWLSDRFIFGVNLGFLNFRSAP